MLSTFSILIPNLLNLGTWNHRYMNPNLFYIFHSIALMCISRIMDLLTVSKSKYTLWASLLTGLFRC